LFAVQLLPCLAALALGALALGTVGAGQVSNTGVSPLRIAKSGDAPVEMTQFWDIENDAVLKIRNGAVLGRFAMMRF
jgi:hypothetical protein